MAAGRPRAARGAMESLLAARWFPGTVQYALLGAALALIYFAWLPDLSPELVAGRSLVYTNIANYAMWVIFKPGLLFTLSVCLGAVWCMICPARAVSDLAHRFSLRLSYPGWLRNFFLLVLLFFLHKVLMEYYDLHWNPWHTAIYTVVLLVLPAIFGFLFGERVYCKFVCPLRLVIGFFALCSPVEYGVKDEAACERCRDKPCLGNSATHGGPACPNRLNPVKLHTNRHCLLCMECLKRCPKGNLGFRLGAPFKGILHDHAWSSGEILLLAVILGCMMEVSLRPVAAAQALYLPGRVLASFLGPGDHVLKELVSGLWAYLAFPWLVLAVPAVLHRLLGISESLFGSMGSYARFFIPLSFAGILPFALMKASRFMGYGWRVLRDPHGIESAEAIARGELAAPAMLLPPPALMAVSVLAVLSAFGVSCWLVFRYARRARKNPSWAFPVAVGFLLPTGIAGLRFAQHVLARIGAL